MQQASQEKIFHDLNNLCTTNEAFFFKDFTSIGGGTYRIFSYRLASYSDFLAPNAFEARGSMWEIKEDGSYIRCACRTLNKFFNAYENPFTMFPKEMLSTEIKLAMDKLDGSVISTFMDNDGVLRVKSNGSLHSEHAHNSNAMIHDNKELLDALIEADLAQYTVTLEYTSPEFRIVLPYQVDDLTVLSLRHRATGDILSGSDLQKEFPILYKYSVFENCGEINSTFPMRETLKDSIDAVRSMQDIEGFVVQLHDGTMFKIKTDWYCALHFTKDSINVDSRLYEAVLQGASDDLKQLFSTDPYCTEKIEKMENLIFLCYNKLQDEVESFVQKHKHLERKAYAEMVKSTLSTDLNRQGLAFALYNGKPVDYKEVLQKYMKVVLADF